MLKKIQKLESSGRRRYSRELLFVQLGSVIDMD
jgi:hypothetical protein